MNYFAHGFAFLDDPYFLAGTAALDWLSVVDRKTRLRREQVEPFADGSGSPAARFAAGILRHLADDDWFHATAGFESATREMAGRFRAHLTATDENPRAAFLGHVAVELILDGVLIAEDPHRLTDYYASLAQVDPGWIAQAVFELTGQNVASLAWFCERFLEARFLFDYLDAAKLVFRLNQVVSRIKLRPLPESTASVIEGGWPIVRRHLPELLPVRKGSGTICSKTGSAPNPRANGA
jgi:hypothetical protein